MERELKKVTRVKNNTAQVQKEFIKNLLADSQEAFMETLDQIREHDPRSYVKFNIELMKMIIPKASEVSVKHGLDKDMQELVLLGMTAGKPRELTDNVLDDLEVFSQYEEIREPEGLIGG